MATSAKASYTVGHHAYDYEVDWEVTERGVMWDARVRRDDKLVAEPFGLIPGITQAVDPAIVHSYVCRAIEREVGGQ